MKISLLAIPLVLGFSLPLHSETDGRVPIMTAVDPAAGTSGDVLTVQGTNLGDEERAAVFLTDGKNDFKVVIVAQTATWIQFKIPAEATAGRFSLMVLTKGKDSRLEPVKVTVEPAASRPAS